MITTVGQAMVNDALPREYRDYKRSMTKDEADDILGRVAKDKPELYRDISHKLVQLGREHAYTEGATLSLSDMINPIPKDRTELLLHVKQQTQKILGSNMNDEEKQQALTGVYSEVQKFLVDKTYETMQHTDNPFAMQVKAKARGNPSQLAALMTTPGIYTDAEDNVIPIFVGHSYAEGLKPHEYWASTYGARKGVVATKFCLAEGTAVLWSDTCRAKRIEHLEIGDTVYAQDNNGCMCATTVTAKTFVGERLCYAYEFGVGGSSEAYIVVGTPEHKIYLERLSSNKRVTAMEPLSKAHVGRRGAVLPSGFVYSEDAKAESRALLLGVLLGDGGLTQQQTKMYLSDKLLVTAVENCAAKHNLKLHIDEIRDTVTTYSLQEQNISAGIGNGHKTPFRAWLNACGVLGKYSYEKRIPPSVYTWDAAAVGALIAGLWATDGCTTFVKNEYGKRYPVVSFYCTSKGLVEDLHKLLRWRFGIYAAPINERRVQTDIPRIVDGHACLRNHNLYGFCIADVQSLQRLQLACPCIAKKIQLLSEALQQPRLRRPNMQACYRTESFVGIRKVYDIEVEHSSHRFVLANGLIVSNSTRDAGRLGKQFNQAAMRTVVTEDDCGTASGIPVPTDDSDNIGSVLARPAGGLPAGTVLDKESIASLSGKGIDKLVVRSPLTCNLPQGVCKTCVGQREGGAFPNLGDHVGINAASALAERIAQTALGTKHSGGMAASKDGDKTYAGFDIIDQLFQNPENFPHEAATATTDGKVDAIEDAPQGGWNVVVNGVSHYALPETKVKVKVGDNVEAGDQLSSGLINPRTVVTYKGIGEGRRYFTERATQAFRDSGYKANRRNMEVLVRGLIDHARVADNADAGDFLPGDVISYNALANTYKPRKDAKRTDLNSATGQYLEEPVMHYTIGTRITKSIAKNLGDFGHERVMVHPDPAPFEPYLVGLRGVPQHESDWMAQLGSTYLKSNLLKNVQRGAESRIHGLHPVPGLAKGVEFGRTSEGVVGY